MTYEEACASAFIPLLTEWPEEGGSLLRWHQRQKVVALDMLHSDLVSERAWQRLLDMRDGVLARVLISPSAITHVDGGSHLGAL